MKIEEIKTIIIVITLMVISFGVGRFIFLNCPICKEKNKTEIIEKYFVDKEDFNFELSSNGYSGWQMGCNYRFGSDADWNEGKQEYGKQEFLRCANGITYKRID